MKLPGMAVEGRMGPPCAVLGLGLVQRTLLRGWGHHLLLGRTHRLQRRAAVLLTLFHPRLLALSHVWVDESLKVP